MKDNKILKEALGDRDRAKARTFKETDPQNGSNQDSYIKQMEETTILRTTVQGVFAEYKQEFNKAFPAASIDYKLTISEQEIDISKVKRDTDPEKYKDLEPELVKTKYFRLEETLIETKYRVPLKEEFIAGFEYQVLNKKKKVWEVTQYDETQDIDWELEDDNIRVEMVIPHESRLLFGNAYPLALDPTSSNTEIEMELTMYRDLIYNLIAHGIEHMSMIQEQNERAKKLKELEGTKPNIDVVSDLPENFGKLSKEDEEYVEFIKKEKAKLDENNKSK